LSLGWGNLISIIGGKTNMAPISQLLPWDRTLGLLLCSNADSENIKNILKWPVHLHPMQGILTISEKIHL